MRSISLLISLPFFFRFVRGVRWVVYVLPLSPPFSKFRLAFVVVRSSIVHIRLLTGKHGDHEFYIFTIRLDRTKTPIKIRKRKSPHSSD